MTDSYKPIVLPLRGGMDQSTPALVGGSGSVNSAVNVDFGFKDEVRGRPGYSRVDTFERRALDVSGNPVLAITTTAWAALPAALQVTPTMVAVRDGAGERPGLAVQGRIWTNNGGFWEDKLGGGCTRVDRVAEYLGGLSYFDGSGNYVPPLSAGWAIGPVTGDASANGMWEVADADGTKRFREILLTHGPGCSARNVNGIELTVVYGTGDIFAVITQAGAPTQVSQIATLATDAAAPTGVGDNPCVCADYDSSFFYVAYVTTTAHTWKILKVDTTPSVVASTTVTFGAGTPKGVWISNARVATNKLVLAMADSVTAGVQTTVRRMTDLTTYSIDSNIGVVGACAGPVTVGAVDQPNAVVTATDTGGTYWVTLRPMTSSGSAEMFHFGGGPAPAAPTHAAYAGRSIWHAHQPVDLNGRVLIGIVATCGWFNTANLAGVSVPGTWYVLDITDTWVSGSTSGNRLRPAIVAQGPRDSTMPVANPYGAVVDWALVNSASVNGGRYRFPSVDFKSIVAPDAPPTSFGVFPFGFGSPVYGVSGSGSLGVNQVSWSRPSADSAGESTILSGSVPHQLSRGLCHEVGFPVARPVFTASDAGAGGSWPADTYNLFAVWRWTDEAGQVHQSEPSTLMTVSVTASHKVQVSVEGPITEREYDQIFVDIYASNSTTPSAHFLQGSVAIPLAASPKRDGGAIAGGTATTATFNAFLAGTSGTGTALLYTDGGALSNTPPRADGGLVSVGTRLWTSDGKSLFASQLPVIGQSPAWNNFGALTVQIPAVAGRIVALTGVDNKLLALCERGVYLVEGFGPDNTGAGADFSPALRLSSLGIVCPRAAVSVPGKGVYFFASNANAVQDDPISPAIGGGAYGGLWHVDRAMNVSRVSWPAQTLLENGAQELAYSPERDALWINLNATADVPWAVRDMAPGRGNYGDVTLVYHDVRSGLWGSWFNPDGNVASAAVIRGALWTVGDPASLDDNGNATGPGTYSKQPGTDTLNLGFTHQPTMTLVLNNLFANTVDPLGWSRVRSIRVLGELVPETLVYTAKLDQRIVLTKTFTVTTPGVTTTWPTDRVAPEWRLPQQKCSSIQVTLAATPAKAAWTALELRVLPLGRAPAYQRG